MGKVLMLLRYGSHVAQEIAIKAHSVVALCWGGFDGFYLQKFVDTKLDGQILSRKVDIIIDVDERLLKTSVGWFGKR